MGAPVAIDRKRRMAHVAADNRAAEGRACRKGCDQEQSEEKKASPHRAAKGTPRR
jgi:hypothetical protein